MKLKKKYVFFNMQRNYFLVINKRNKNFVKLFGGKDNYMEMMFIRRLLYEFFIIDFNINDYDYFISYVNMCLTSITKKPYIKYTRKFYKIWLDVYEFFKTKNIYLNSLKDWIEDDLLTILGYKKFIKLSISNKYNIFSFIFCIEFYNWKEKRNRFIRLSLRRNAKINKKIN